MTKYDLPNTTDRAIKTADSLLRGVSDAVREQSLAMIRENGPTALRTLFPTQYGDRAVPRRSTPRRAVSAPPAFERVSPYAGDAVSARVIEEAIEQEVEALRENSEIGYMMRALALSAMPYVDPHANEFTRKNGQFTFSMLVNSEVGLPYGIAPRLICLWLSTQVKLTREPFVQFGPSLSAFMRDVGVAPRTGKNGNMATFRDQLIRLTATNFTAFFESGTQGERSMRIQHIRLFEEAEFWWDAHREERFRAWGQVSHQFFQDISNAAVPVSMDAIHQLKRSPLAIDLYIWLTYRLFGLRRTTAIPWDFLSHQFGSQIAELYEFKRQVKKALASVLRVYPEARVSLSRSQLVLEPSPPHVASLRKTS